MKLTVEVLQDDGGPETYEISGTDEDTAIMLAFAMDGGFGPAVSEQGLELAQMYCSIILWDGKTKAQLKSDNEAWQEEFDRKSQIWDDWYRRLPPFVPGGFV